MASGLVRTSVLSVKQASQSKTHKYLNKRNREQYFCNQRIRKDKEWTLDGQEEKRKYAQRLLVACFFASLPAYVTVC